MEIKILCGCGTKYKFDVDPINGRMPVPAICPNCGSSGTTEANQQIARMIPQASTPAMTVPAPAMAPAVPGSGIRVRLAGVATAAAATLAEAPITGRSGADGERPLLERTTFLVKERVSALKLTDTYDIFDPRGGQTIGIAKEEPPVWAKWLRLAVNKRIMPTAINVYEAEGQPPVLSIQRGFTFLRSKINVVSGGRPLGFLRSKFLSIGGGFHVFDNTGAQVAEVKGNLIGWEFRFLNKNGREIGTVSKKWAGALKELFTSADNYVIALTDLSDANEDTSALLLAAGLAIDIVYKEKA